MREAAPEVVLEPHRNRRPASRARPAHREIRLRGPDGYVVALRSPGGESP